MRSDAKAIERALLNQLLAAFMSVSERECGVWK
jgi:hypothetical protein